MLNLIKTAVLIGIGALDKTKEVVRDLVRRGENNQGPAARCAKDLLAEVERACTTSNTAILDCLGVATKADMAQLLQQVSDLAQRTGRGAKT